MGLVSKLKNILFEEEEVEIPVIEKKEKKVEVVQENRDVPRKEEVKVNNYQSVHDFSAAKKEEVKIDDFNDRQTVSEREIFKSEKTFNFPAFDEEEFDSFVPKKRSTNIIEHERKKVEKIDYRKDYKKSEEPKEVKKFKPSPIISPVYGILDKNYTPDEITTRTEMTLSRSLDVDVVRKKAFGSLEEVVKEEVLQDKELEEKLEKARTIDELLKDSSDEVIDIKKTTDEEFETFSSIEDLEELEEENDKKEEIKKHQENLEDDTLENDLFDLIDSMYENREED